MQQATGTNHLRTTMVLATAALAAVVLLALVGTRPAEATSSLLAG
jgi:hypothetical protein